MNVSEHAIAWLAGLHGSSALFATSSLLPTHATPPAPCIPEAKAEP